MILIVLKSFSVNSTTPLVGDTSQDSPSGRPFA